MGISDFEEQPSRELLGRQLFAQCLGKRTPARLLSLNRVNDRDTHIISQEQTVSTLYEAAQSLRSLNEEDIYPSVLVLLRDHVGVQLKVWSRS